jgi:hypothetical protein
VGLAFAGFGIETGSTSYCREYCGLGGLIIGGGVGLLATSIFDAAWLGHDDPAETAAISLGWSGRTLALRGRF